MGGSARGSDGAGPSGNRSRSSAGPSGRIGSSSPGMLEFSSSRSDSTVSRHVARETSAQATQRLLPRGSTSKGGATSAAEVIVTQGPACCVFGCGGTQPLVHFSSGDALIDAVMQEALNVRAPARSRGVGWVQFVGPKTKTS